MQQQTTSAWIIEARRRWFNRRIEGDGHYALALCHDVVRLMDCEMFARAAVNYDCCLKPGECRFRHELFDLRERPTPKFASGRASAQVTSNTADRRERERV